jgi:CDP-2,3-bis-(O-geranylgeranyl)-sn-glycerol synthase
MSIILKLFLFFLPAGIANLTPVLFKKIPILNKPINKKLLGAHKTYRGFLFGILTAILTVYIEIFLYPYIKDFTFINYSQVNALLLGFLLGFGALLGDSIKSYFKRKLKIKPGDSWVPFDQLDWIIFALIFVNFYIKLTLKESFIILIIFGLLHPLINLIGYFLKIKKTKF